MKLFIFCSFLFLFEAVLTASVKGDVSVYVYHNGQWSQIPTTTISTPLDKAQTQTTHIEDDEPFEEPPKYIAKHYTSDTKIECLGQCGNNTEAPDLCADSRIDTIFSDVDGYQNIFKGYYYWKLNEGADSIQPGYPKPISSRWKELPAYIDAAFTAKDGKTYFFKGSIYWRYTGTVLDDDYPKAISEGFPGIPNNVDSVLTWGGNGKTYFFKGNYFWKFDPTQKKYPVDRSYPKPINLWRGIPDYLDAATVWHGITYFFKYSTYFRFDDAKMRVNTDYQYPAPINSNWLGCNDIQTDIL